MSLSGLVSAFEQASRDAQVASTRAAAEQSLKSFFSHPEAIAIAVAVAETTTSSLARFHAAAALHSAARKRWASLTPAQRYGQGSLRYWIINNVLANAGLVPYERRAMLRTAAFLTRRAYLEESTADRDAFFATLERTAMSTESPQHVAVAAIELIDLIVEDFLAPSLSSSASVIEREMFLRTRQEFAAPNGDIVRLFKAAKDSLAMLLSAGSGVLSSSHWQARAVPAVSTIVKIITTDTKKLGVSSDDNSLFSQRSDLDDTADPVTIHKFVGSDWTSILGHVPELLQIAFAITAQQIGAKDTSDESLLLSGTTRVIIAIAAIKQASYERTAVNAGEILAGILGAMEQQKWCSCRMGLVRLAYAEVWRRIACSHSLSSVESLPHQWIAIFKRDTCAALAATAARLSSPEGEDDVFSTDVVDLLMETWGNLALQGDDGSMREHRLSSHIEEVITHFMRTFLRSSGNAAAIHAASERLDNEEDFGFEDSSIDDSRLFVAASLTRFALDRLAEQIRHSLMTVARTVFNWQGGQANLPSTLSVFQEDLFFLMHFTSAVVADDAKGETPSIPPQFVRSSYGSDEKRCTTHATKVQALLHAIIEVAQGETHLINQRGVHCDEASPRIATAALDALARICRTYIVPADASSASIAVQIAGGEQFMESSINVCFEKATEGLLRRSFENDIAESASGLLTHLAMSTKTYESVRKSNFWQHLMGQGVEVYQSLPATAVQEVGRSLATVQADEIAERLLMPAFGALQGFAVAQDTLADAAERIIAIINLLRGVAEAGRVGNRTKQALLQSLQPEGVTALCAKAFSRNRPDVSRSLISLADSIVCSLLSLLNDDEARGLMTNAVKLIDLHTNIVNAQKDILSVDEVAHDAEEMIALLADILEEAVDIDAGDPCYYGLSTVLSIMSETLLDLPQVGKPFFLIVTRLVCRYPGKLLNVSPALSTQILHIIDMQRISQDTIAERRGLSAIAALGRAWTFDNRDGTAREAVGKVLRGFCESIFKGVATGSAHTSNLDAASDALLPLIHVKFSPSSSALEELGQALLVSCGQNDEIRAELEELARAGSRANSMCGYGVQSNAASKSCLPEREAVKIFRGAIFRFSSNTRNALLTAALGQTPAR